MFRFLNSLKQLNGKLAAVFGGVGPLLSAANLPNPLLLVSSLICLPETLLKTQES
jgi:hypothetical protein